MKKIISSLIIATYSYFACLSFALAQINIFTCEEEWASLAKEITQNKARILNAVKGNQDAHYVQAKPSLIAKIRNADMIFCTGADLESGWLPLIMEKSYKNSAKDKEVGYLLAANYVEKLEIIKDKVLTRSMGHIHPSGNPHIHLNPNNIAIIAKEFTNRLKIIDAKNSQFYQNNLDNFLNKWQNSLNIWQKRAQKLNNINLISYHNAWSYLINWLNIDLVTTIEAKPGITPGLKHLNKIVTLAKKDNIDLIIYAPFEPIKNIDWLSQKAKIKAVELPFSIDKNHNVKDLFELFDQILNKLEQNT